EKAKKLGYHSQIISAGRKTNDEMGKHVASNTIKQLILSDQNVKGAKVAIFGVTFRENVPDIRNTKVIDIIDELKTYGVDVLVYDRVADNKEVTDIYDIDIIEKDELYDINAVVLAVSHDEFEDYSIDE